MLGSRDKPGNDDPFLSSRHKAWDDDSVAVAADIKVLEAGFCQNNLTVIANILWYIGYYTFPKIRAFRKYWNMRFLRCRLTT